jgi:ATP/maltotriose-dependent transcriptional regulator MalT
MFLELGDETFAARVLMFSGIVSHRLGDLTDARHELSQSIDLASREGIRGTRAHAQLTLAQVAMDVGDPNAAPLFRECQTVFEMIGDVRCAAVCKRSLGSLELDNDELDVAVELLRQSIEDLASMDRPALAVAIADIATIYQRRGEISDAIKLVDAARTLAQTPSSDIGLSAGEFSRVQAAAAATNAIRTTHTASSTASQLDVNAIVEIARQAEPRPAVHSGSGGSV